jgi:hypothetical protein
MRRFKRFSTKNIISKLVVIPQTLQEAIRFLKYLSIIGYSSPLKEHFIQSIKLLSTELKDLLFEDLNPFSLAVLKNIYSSEHLHISNEDCLFSIIPHLIKIKPNRKCLFHFVLFPNVSINVLKGQFSNLKAEDIDSDLLETNKSRLIFDYKSETINNLPIRYSNSNIMEISNHEGIFSRLRNENPNSVSVEASSYHHSSYPISNLFVHSNSIFELKINQIVPFAFLFICTKWQFQIIFFEI